MHGQYLVNTMVEPVITTQPQEAQFVHIISLCVFGLMHGISQPTGWYWVRCKKGQSQDVKRIPFAIISRNALPPSISYRSLYPHSLVFPCLTGPFPLFEVHLPWMLPEVGVVEGSDWFWVTRYDCFDKAWEKEYDPRAWGMELNNIDTMYSSRI
ncbi:hypothetical protein B0H10DRAFT_1954559 [Mycena sp. CBHHK59/15]|nr:hypothetical protein B0H10DRAFT_1954559 [Mycena sp. CBHHK59/15]